MWINFGLHIKVLKVYSKSQWLTYKMNITRCMESWGDLHMLVYTPWWTKMYDPDANESVSSLQKKIIEICNSAWMMYHCTKLTVDW